MANVAIANRLDQTLSLSLLNEWGYAVERTLPPQPAQVEVDEATLTDYTRGLARRGHITIRHV
jgi:hypothetical protein